MNSNDPSSNKSYPLMRTFPKSLATFRKIVSERGEQLRKLEQNASEMLKTTSYTEVW